MHDRVISAWPLSSSSMQSPLRDFACLARVIGVFARCAQHQHDRFDRRLQRKLGVADQSVGVALETWKAFKVGADTRNQDQGAGTAFDGVQLAGMDEPINRAAALAEHFRGYDRLNGEALSHAHPLDGGGPPQSFLALQLSPGCAA